MRDIYRAASPEDAVAALWDAIEGLGGHLVPAREVDDEVFAGMAPDQILLDVLAPAQREVGRRWERNEWGVTDEHAATTVTDATEAAVVAAARPLPVEPVDDTLEQINSTVLERRHAALLQRREELVESVFGQLLGLLPPMREYDERQLEHSRADRRYIFQFIEAAVLTGDRRILDEFFPWMQVVLSSRGVPPTVLLSEFHDAEHHVLLTLSGGKVATTTPAFPVHDTFSGWVYDTTEVPSGLTFNPAAPEAVTLQADPAQF